MARKESLDIKCANRSGITRRALEGRGKAMAGCLQVMFYLSQIPGLHHEGGLAEFHS